MSENWWFLMFFVILSFVVSSHHPDLLVILKIEVLPEIFGKILNFSTLFHHVLEQIREKTNKNQFSWSFLHLGPDFRIVYGFFHIILKASLTTCILTRYKLTFADYTLRYQPKNREKEQKLMIFAVFLYF